MAVGRNKVRSAVMDVLWADSTAVFFCSDEGTSGAGLGVSLLLEDADSTTSPVLIHRSMRVSSRGEIRGLFGGILGESK